MAFTCYRCEVWPCTCPDSITLIHGDNCEVMGQLPKECVDLVVTSPPYDDLRIYAGHQWDFYGVAWNLKRLLRPGGVLVWVVCDQTVNGSETGTSMRQALHFQSMGFLLHDTMVYHRNGCPFPETNRYYPAWEFMFVLSRGQPDVVNLLEDRENTTAGNRAGQSTQRERDGSLQPMSASRVEPGRKTKPYGVRFNIWKYNVGNAKSTEDAIAFKHPATYPEGLARDHILSWSNPGDLVLDCFNGSGTTLKMTKKLGRRGLGIEIEETYCQIAALRLRQEVFQFE